MSLRRLAPFLLAVLCLLPVAGGPGRAEGTGPVLLVVVEGIRNESGRVHVGVWDDAEGFGKNDRRVAGANAPVTGPSQILAIHGLEPGKYAMAVFHDENDNGKFDRTWIGLPDEGLGFSNGAWITIFGAPSFDSASIELKAPSTRAVIALRY